MKQLREALIGKHNIDNVIKNRIYCLALFYPLLEAQLRKNPKIEYFTWYNWGVYLTKDSIIVEKLTETLKKNCKSWWLGYVDNAKNIDDAKDILVKYGATSETIIKIDGPCSI